MLVRQWKSLPREAVDVLDVPHLEVFKVRLDAALSTLVSWKMSLPMAGVVELNDLYCPFQPKPFYELQQPPQQSGCIHISCWAWSCAWEFPRRQQGAVSQKGVRESSSSLTGTEQQCLCSSDTSTGCYCSALNGTQGSQFQEVGISHLTCFRGL